MKRKLKWWDPTSKNTFESYIVVKPLHPNTFEWEIWDIVK